MKVLDVTKWEDLKGTHCRVRQTHDGVQAIGHIIKDQWFTPEDLNDERHS